MDRRSKAEFETAMSFAGDETRLLEGEDASTTYLDDATHWMSVYAELCSFKQELLKVVGQQIEQVAPAGGEEVRQDLALLQAQAARLQHRLSFWQQRRAELQARS